MRCYHFPIPLPVRVLFALVGCCACASRPAGSAAPAAAPAAGPSAAAPAAPGAPRLRLPKGVRPTHYAAELRVAPTEDSFSGLITIDLALDRAVPTIWLNGADLQVSEARLEAAGETRAARVVPGGDDFLGFAFDRPVGPGPARLHVKYQGTVSRKDSRGLFHQKEGDDWYAFTQFEAIDARRAFPCFDEPGYKVPWQLTLHVPKADRALSNTPILGETEGPAGWKTVRFAETKPLPSYLVALAVGPFEIVDAGTTGQKSTAVRIVTPRARGAEARYAVQVSPVLLKLLEEYFGIPYPYEKLDVLAIPQFGGAMENPGLVTFSQSLVLQKPDEETIRGRRLYAIIAAHEFAHQWFGDLVTTAWWDDIWLNEAFASWMEIKIIARWQPSWGPEVDRIDTRSGAMRQDTLASARQIRQPIESKDDIANAFDGITYDKGASVIGMFERWVGAEPFQKGIHAYLEQHAHGNATARDFLAAVSSAAGRDVATPFSTFLDQAGVPIVTAELVCAPGAAPRLRLSQERYLPIGAERPVAAAQKWQIPVCARFGGPGAASGRACTLLAEEKADLDLTGAKQCPAWVLANEGALGYYETLYQGDLLGRLLKDGGKKLTLPERVGVVEELETLTSGGRIPAAETLGLVPVLARDPDRHIASSVAGAVSGLREHLVPAALLPNYRRLIEKLYGARARALGFVPKKAENDDTRLLRPTLLGLVAEDGEDARLAAEAERLARRWLGDRKAIDPELTDLVLRLAARRGDRALWDRLHDEARRTTDRRERRRLLSALAAFRDPELVKRSLALVISGEFDIREASLIMYTALGDTDTRAAAYAFIKESFDALVARMPRDAGAGLVWSGVGFCDEQHQKDVAAFFQGRSTRFAGGPRDYKQALESLSQCIASKKLQEPAVSAFLKNY